MFVGERGWVLNLQEQPKLVRAPACKSGPRLAPGAFAPDRLRGVAVRMTFAAAETPEWIGENPLAEHQNYFLGDDESRWRTEVPKYASLLCRGIYPGVDVRVRTAGDHPEYDVLLEPWADIRQVRIDVEGADGLRVAADGALVIDTAMGPIRQPMPRTWQVDAGGEMRPLRCEYRLLGPRRFGFVVPGWDRDSELTIDPGLIWSTFVGSKSLEVTSAVAVASNGVTTAAGFTFSPGYPTVPGSFDRVGNGGADVIVTQLDPSGSNLISSTFLGGLGDDSAFGLHVDPKGVITVAGVSASNNFPTTAGAMSSTYKGNGDAFVFRLDPARTGKAQLVYSTLVGGLSKDVALGAFADVKGVVTIAGTTESPGFPTTSNSFDTTFNGRDDAFVTRLDPRKTGAAQLVYSTFLGGKEEDTGRGLSVDALGIVSVCGNTVSAGFPVTKRAYQTTHSGGHDVYVARLNLGPTSDAKLLYSTFIGGRGDEGGVALSVDADGVMTFGGYTSSKLYPTTAGAFDTTFNGVFDLFVSRLDPRLGSRQLVFSTVMGGTLSEHVAALDVDSEGVVTVGGGCNFTGFPTTPDAHDRLWGGLADGIIARLDPRKTGAEQLLYSTYIGDVEYDDVHALDVTPSGTVIVAGHTRSLRYPTTSKGYDTTLNGSDDVFVTHMEMGVSFYADVHRLSLQTGGTQNFTLNPGKQYRGMPYIILGSVTGTTPGIALSGVKIPLNFDSYTRVTLGLISPVFRRFRGRLDHNGREVASFNVPPFLTSEIDLTIHHALVVLDTQNNVIAASNPVPVRLR
jgi:hypothetical protein